MGATETKSMVKTFVTAVRSKMGIFENTHGAAMSTRTPCVLGFARGGCGAPVGATEVKTMVKTFVTAVRSKSGMFPVRR